MPILCSVGEAAEKPFQEAGGTQGLATAGNGGCEMERGGKGPGGQDPGLLLGAGIVAGQSETLGTGDSASGTEGGCPDPSSEPPLEHHLRLPLGAQRAKHLPAKWETGFQPWSGRSPGEAHGSPFQDSCLENPMDRGAWRAAVRGVAQSRTRLSTLTSFSLFSSVESRGQQARPPGQCVLRSLHLGGPGRA